MQAGKVLTIVVLLLLLSVIPLPARSSPDVSFEIYPQYAAKDGTPFTVILNFTGLEPETVYDIRVGLRNRNLTGVMKTPSKYWSLEVSDWYRSDWGTEYFRTDANGNWSGSVHIRINTDSENYPDVIAFNSTALLGVDYRKAGESIYTGWQYVEVELLDMGTDTSGGVPGGWVEGYVLSDSSPIENETVILENLTGTVVATYHSEQNTVNDGYPSLAGYFRMAAPEGESYLLKVLDQTGSILATKGNITVTAYNTTFVTMGLPITPEERSVIIAEVYYDTILYEGSDLRPDYGVDEYVRIHNPSTVSVNISGWVLEDLDYSVEFPEGAVLDALGDVYITSNGTAFGETMGFFPDFEYEVDSSPSIPDMIAPGKVPWFENGGDVISLRHRRPEFLIDRVVYGDESFEGEGWDGPPVPGVSETYILRRRVNEEIWEFVDTNRSDDWVTISRPRAGQSSFQYTEISFTGNVTAFVSPDSSFGVVAGFIENTTESLSISLYQFENLYLMDRVAEICQRGVDVRILLEGGPVAGITLKEKFVAQSLYEAGCAIRFMINDPSNDIYNRYRFLHAKYAISDWNRTLIFTENWKDTGVPTDPSYGNRGWGILIDSPAVAKYFLEVFDSDWDGGRRDIREFDPSDETYGGPGTYTPEREIPTGQYPASFSELTLYGDFTASPILAPDTSLLTTKAVIGLINEAEDSLYISQFYIHPYWKDGEEIMPNLYLEAAIDAARRGVEVRILLDSYWYNVEEDDPLSNLRTMEYVNRVSVDESLPLEARLVNLLDSGFEKLHTKGVIVDGRKTLVSSINWNRHSPTYNREVGVILESTEIGAYFTSVFNADWSNATKGPKYGVELSTDETVKTVKPGDTLVFQLQVRNTGNVWEDIDLTVSQVPAGWSTHLSVDTLRLAPYSTTVVNLTIDVPADAESGDLIVTVAALAEGGEVADYLDLTTRVEAGIVEVSILLWLLLAAVIIITVLYILHRRRMGGGEEE